MEKFRETEKSFLKISVFSNEKKKLAPGWNVALKNYNGDAIIRIDAHATIPNNYIRKKNFTQRKIVFIYNKNNS